MKQGTAKVKCSCEHRAQDEMYGKGMRIANATATQDDKGGTADVRCTVCSHVHRVRQAEVS